MSPDSLSPEPSLRDKLHTVTGDTPAGISRIAPGANPGNAPRPPIRRKRRWGMASLGIVVAVAAAGAVAWWYLHPHGEAAERWVTAPVTTGDIEDSVTALGNLQPKNYVDVGAQVSGQLTRIDVQIGQKVKAGDLLAEIDPTLQQAKVTADQAALANLQAQMVDKQAQLDLANKQLIRQQNLMKADATSEDTLQIAEATARSDRAQLAALQAQTKQAQSTLAADQANLGYTKIYAPMSGTVVSLTAQQGQTLNANQAAPIILRIADLSTMTVWTQVSEADVPRLKIGMDAYFTTLGDQNHSWPGKLSQILPTPDVVNNVVLFPALFDVANPDGKLMTQMSAQVFFVVASVKNAVTVPVAALREGRISGGRAEKASGEASAAAATPAPAPSMDGDDAKSYEVHVIGPNGRPERRQVWIGVMNRVSAEVLSGLEPGDVVIIGRQASEQGSTGAGGSRGGTRPGGGLGRGL
jgi:macrolide-specific efflux system membrane fusion protein